MTHALYVGSICRIRMVPIEAVRIAKKDGEIQSDVKADGLSR